MIAATTPLRRVPRELIGVRQAARCGDDEGGILVDRGPLRVDRGRSSSSARLNLDTIELAIDMVDLIAKPIAEKHRIVPVFASASELSIATADPTQLPMFDSIGRQLKRAITVVISTPAEIDRALVRLYEQRRAPHARTRIGDLSQEDLAAASHVVNSIIAAAIAQKASDIHHRGERAADDRAPARRRRAAPGRDPTDRDPRRDRVAHQGPLGPRHLDPPTRRRTAGSSCRRPPARSDLRVSVLPTYWGEKVVCRLLDNKRAMLGLDALGFDAAHATAYSKMIHAPYSPSVGIDGLRRALKKINQGEGDGCPIRIAPR